MGSSSLCDSRPSSPWQRRLHAEPRAVRGNGGEKPAPASERHKNRLADPVRGGLGIKTNVIVLMLKTHTHTHSTSRQPVQAH